MEFKIRDDIVIRARSVRSNNEMTEYRSNDIARYVSYFLNKINKITDHTKPIGVKLGHLSFVSICCMLALVKSGRNYAVVYHQNFNLREDIDYLFSHVFYLGPFPDRNNDVLNFEIEGAEHTVNTDLTFAFQPTQVAYYLPDNTSKLEILTSSGKIEASSTKAAMDHYFTDNDYCVFHRPMQHIGVATLCIYPALFKVKNISICINISEWAQEINQATHVHFGYTMITDKFPLPKKLRILTTGGYDFNQDCIEYVRSICDVDTIVDCYGTRNCPPPLAIRQLTISKYPIPFKWINNFIKPDVRENILYLTAVEPNVIACEDTNHRDYRRTQDLAFAVDETTLYLKVGPRLGVQIEEKSKHIISNVRMHHTTYPDCDFSQFVKDNTSLSLKLAFHYDQGIYYPSLLVNASEAEQCVKYVSDNDIEAIVYVRYDQS